MRKHGLCWAFRKHAPERRSHCLLELTGKTITGLQLNSPPNWRANQTNCHHVCMCARVARPSANGSSHTPATLAHAQQRPPVSHTGSRRWQSCSPVLLLLLQLLLQCLLCQCHHRCRFWHTSHRDRPRGAPRPTGLGLYSPFELPRMCFTV